MNEQKNKVSLHYELNNIRMFEVETRRKEA